MFPQVLNGKNPRKKKPMTLTDFADPDIVERAGANVSRHIVVCKECNVPIQETITGRRYVDGVAHCSDCYFGHFGDEIDNYPIHSPRRNFN